MAKMSPEKTRKLFEETGNWVNEECDICHNPILTPYSYKKKNQTLCAICAKGHDLVSTKIKEENENMKATAEKKAAKASGKEVPSTKIANGHLRKETAIGDLYEFLEDEKKHPLKDALKSIAKYKIEPMGRLQQLNRYGKKFGWFVSIDKEAGVVQMKMGKPTSDGTAKKAKKEADEEDEPKPKAKAKAKDKEEDDAPAQTKQQASVRKLVRRTLTDGKDYTRNKLIEKLVDEYELEAKDVQQAINMEVRAGGVKVKGTTLELV